VGYTKPWKSRDERENLLGHEEIRAGVASLVARSMLTIADSRAWQIPW
jgi:hypothetical protein